VSELRSSPLSFNPNVSSIVRLKNASPSKQEHARYVYEALLANVSYSSTHVISLDVENAEDDLVQKTEVAIQQMKAVLDNPEPLRNLNELVKAQVCNYLPRVPEAST